MHEGQRLCGAKTRKGTPCKGLAMENGRCRMHNGGAVSGIAHPSFKHGMYSKVLPARLQGTYDEISAQEPGNLLDMSAEFALYQVRTRELVANLDVKEAAARTRDIQKQASTVRRLQRLAGETSDRQRQEEIGAELREALNTLWFLIDKAAEDWQVWEDIDKATNKAEKLGRYEQDRLVRMHAVVSTEQAVGMFNELVRIVRENVSDRDALRKIQEGMNQMVGVGG